jgi:RNA polymerase sigma-70 factor (ECF subfamily)
MVMTSVAEFSDRELIGEIRGGSMTAFERLVGRYERLVYSIAFGFTGDREAALDVSQNVFLRVHSKLSTYDDTQGSFKSWVARVTMNEGCNWRRRHRRQPVATLDDQRPAASDPSPEDRVWEREAWQLVNRSLARLRPEHQLAVALRYFEGMPIREISIVLGRSEGVVKSILFRSLQKIRSHVRASTEVA